MLCEGSSRISHDTTCYHHCLVLLLLLALLYPNGAAAAAVDVESTVWPTAAAWALAPHVALASLEIATTA
jgi:hypothetical protein